MNIRNTIIGTLLAAGLALAVVGCSSKAGTKATVAQSGAAVSVTKAPATKAATKTPVPTATPKPAAATTDAATASYTLTVKTESTTMSQSLKEFQTLMTSPKLGDDQWTSQVAVQLATWRVLYNEAKQLTAPQPYAAFQVAWVAALSSYNDASYDIAAGVDNVDAATLAKANGEIATANQLIQAADALIP